MVGLLAGVVYALRAADDRIFGQDAKPGDPVTVTIPDGSNGSQIAGILEKAGVVDSATKFELRLVGNGDGDNFKPGVYQLRQNEDYDAIVKALNAGPATAAVVRLVVPEGFSVNDISRRVARLGITPKQYSAALEAAAPPKGFLVQGEKAPRLEGFLWPATYEVPKPAKAKPLVADQLAAFEDNFAKLDLAYPTSKGLTKYDVLKIASLIEREAAFPGDRAKISAVIYNRLQNDMALGIDPTIQYAKGNWQPLTPADLEIDSPYNSRTVKGLPPTPICSPGLASLRAAVKPAKENWLYFVAIPGDAKRRHFFTPSFEEFKQFQRDNPPETTGTDTGASTAGQDSGAAGAAAGTAPAATG
jgi:uncharacterized YceG family protein